VCLSLLYAAIYRCLLVVCGKFQRKEEAQSLFETMKKEGIKPTSGTHAFARASQHQ
jgi:pentatricopeptide repeat protein